MSNSTFPSYQRALFSFGIALSHAPTDPSTAKPRTMALGLASGFAEVIGLLPSDYREMLRALLHPLAELSEKYVGVERTLIKLQPMGRPTLVGNSRDHNGRMGTAHGMTGTLQATLLHMRPQLGQNSWLNQMDSIDNLVAGPLNVSQGETQNILTRPSHRSREQAKTPPGIPVLPVASPMSAVGAHHSEALRVFGGFWFAVFTFAFLRLNTYVYFKNPFIGKVSLADQACTYLAWCTEASQNESLNKTGIWLLPKYITVSGTQFHLDSSSPFLLQMLGAAKACVYEHMLACIRPMVFHGIAPLSHPGYFDLTTKHIQGLLLVYNFFGWGLYHLHGCVHGKGTYNQSQVAGLAIDEFISRLKAMTFSPM
ncbi:hypothetical protein BJ138DRAFT_1107004 [Hygrophoropsis aurantiaca]|uniref:Uncharacterized protein n=1 Tax=Hygrophoropsis aurantiaca TaxID=72124 RepID=A0ACB7ZSQ8_9AGAM|nr:hypothetical protein BJ138DRAFT_1107004 [Hygrophoropsis aurantiaca]